MASTTRWDSALWDSADYGWDVDGTIYRTISPIQRFEQVTPGVFRREDVKRFEVVTPGVFRRVDE